MKQKRFSMIEMLVVVLIVGIIAGMAAVQLDGFVPDSRIKQQVRYTAQMIEMASSQATVEGRPLAIVFDREKGEMRLEYYIEDDEDSSIEFLDEEDREDQEPLYIQDWNPSVSLMSLSVEDLDGESEESEQIVFFPEGSCDGAELTWRDESGLKQTMSLWPLLAKVSLSPLDDSEVWR
jgi:general secretion pathway protein H